MPLKRGKKPARPGAVALRLRDYLIPAEIPPIPAVFDSGGKVTNWQMLGNDQVGDCPVAGAFHEHMIWDSTSQTPLPVDTATAIKNYVECTQLANGIPYDPSQTDAQGNNPTDTGLDMQWMAEHRRSLGILDAAGVRHTIGGYVGLNPGDPYELHAAMWLTQAVGIGFRLPDSAEQQFQLGQPWTVVRGAQIGGGHYVIGKGRTAAGFNSGVSWGSPFSFDDTFYSAYNDETIAMVSNEMLTSGKTYLGIDIAHLFDDITQITQGSGS